MKTIRYIGVLVFFVIIHACTSDDDSNGLRIEYENSFIETLFLEAGETAPPVVNWSGEKGTFSATTLPITAPDDLFNRNLSIDEETGALSWDRSIPLGETEVFITASNSLESTTISVTINNTFIEGLFVGGFNNDTSDEPNFFTIENDTFLILSKDGTAALSSTSDSDVSFIGTGTWTADDGDITINYITTNSPGENLVMKGFLNGRNSLPAALFSGKWGKELNQNNNIENLMGIFRFEND
ncbi:hypothetical protein [uncultured Aquimarina sp.]|uniref:hypothetical protein n=1 Tax=uncultured Aquimarina sp. TaxID=575652 RepID=UPI0026248340|nr:hypothetical protein [uncultured Aquimarina sp.]